ncbi:hypothetical protein AX16_007948 [Volvariella volvacea WC 439]|nr:hypothetical protein AX16_007948 [Volvariella volvacea WC 439]
MSTLALYNSHADPILPPELEELIFKLAAWGDRAHAPRLLLVAHRVHYWVEPIVYDTIVCSSHCEWHPLCPQPPVARYAGHVRHLLLVDLDIDDHCWEHLSACRRVEDLAIWAELTPKTISWISGLPLKRLSVHIEDLFRDGTLDFRHPVFFNITHLDILDDIDFWGRLDELPLLPDLTHLSLNGPNVDYATVDHILKNCKRLRVLFLVHGNKYLDTLPQDRRIVVPEHLGGHDGRVVNEWVDEWKLGCVAGEDYWERADRLVASREQARNNNTAGDDEEGRD